MAIVSRRAFFAVSSLGLAAAVPRVNAAPAMVNRIDGGPLGSFPTQEPDLVGEVVAKAHVDYERVRELVTPRPALAKAAWDWGFGDWESALGAASHMGRRDIAEVLTEHGARPNLFTFAMLGQVDVVRAICRANPGIQRLHGPHGITLLSHARKGSAQAASVVEYLEELGGADIGQVNEPLDEQTAQIYAGAYVPEGAAGVGFKIGFDARRNVLTFRRDERIARFLMHRGNHAFNPSGAADVWIEFTVNDWRSSALSIRDGELEVTATRK